MRAVSHTNVRFFLAMAIVHIAVAIVLAFRYHRTGRPLFPWSSTAVALWLPLTVASLLMSLRFRRNTLAMSLLRLPFKHQRLVSGCLLAFSALALFKIRPKPASRI